MDVSWEEGELTAVQLAKVMNARIGRVRNTTCTAVKKLAERGAVTRRDPGFCRVCLSA